jgi:DNA-directed RNA polymerase specialized sigma24 family protein
MEMTSTKGLHAQAFSKLLGRLGDSPDQAGEKYEALRRVLLRFFEWRGSPFPEEQTDETLNRVARKLDEGVEIANINAYCYEVGRYVLLESLRSHEAQNIHFDSVAYDIPHNDAAAEASEKERRMACLDECLAALTDENREMILEYYDDDAGDLIGRRRTLAAKWGLRRDALANRAQRLRDKLETCVRRCVGKNR